MFENAVVDDVFATCAPVGAWLYSAVVLGYAREGVMYPASEVSWLVCTKSLKQLMHFHYECLWAR